MRAAERAAFAFPGGRDGELNVRTFLSDALHSRVEQDFDAVLLHDAKDFCSNVGILAAEQLRSLLQDGHAAAKAPEKLPKFEADITASDDEEMFRNGVELHDARAVEIGDAWQAFESGHRGPAARIDKKPI